MPGRRKAVRHHGRRPSGVEPLRRGIGRACGRCSPPGGGSPAAGGLRACAGHAGRAGRSHSRPRSARRRAPRTSPRPDGPHRPGSLRPPTRSRRLLDPPHGQIVTKDELDDITLDEQIGDRPVEAGMDARRDHPLLRPEGAQGCAVGSWSVGVNQTRLASRSFDSIAPPNRPGVTAR